MTLTQKDFDQIDRLMDEKFDFKLKNLPTKEEFFSKMDEVIGELKNVREEHEILSKTVSVHEYRLETLEKAHPEIIAS